MYKVSIDFDGKEYSLEAGKYAKFANGSVMLRCGDTMILATVVAGAEKLGIDFLPLQIEYREKMSAAGKIPGGFLKREGRPSEKEILVARLVDRPCRPMFPKGWYFDTQIVIQVLSAEDDVDPGNLAAVAASAALIISDIPFKGPISEVRIGRKDGQFVVNPSIATLAECDLDLTIAGTDKSINMVEGESNEISEKEFIEAIQFGHQKVKELNALQNKLLAAFSQEKVEVAVKEIPSEIFDAVEAGILDDLKKYVYSVTTKKERTATRKVLRAKAGEIAAEKFADNEEYADSLNAFVGQSFGKLEKREMRTMIIQDKKRLDGRKLDEIRPIATEVGLLPRTHGSALFTRGETQAIATATLGTSRDEQMIDGLLPTYKSKFYLHYNFPSFSVGETGRFGGQSRREIGHGNLAERALRKVLPNDDDFGYTIRVISDILESNGSSSMATVCSGSMALMEAGVPLKAPVAGIAMGLIMEDENNYSILSDILGDEDFLGDMDFKVAGTEKGITACQMDIKVEGLSVDVLTQALDQAHAGRMHILGKMAETITTHKDDVSQYAPRFTSLYIDTDMIGAVIGPGGANIREIVAESGAEVNIEDDGKIIVSAVSKEDSDKAIAMIKTLTTKPEEGKIYTGKVKELREGLGAFVEFMPKNSGLLHISQIAWERVEDMTKYINVGDVIEVKLLEVSRDGKFRLSRKVLTEKPEGFVEPEPRPRRDSRDGDRRGGGGRDRRDDRRGGDRR